MITTGPAPELQQLSHVKDAPARDTLALYLLPWVVRMTSGARYAGVPTLDPGADCKFSSWQGVGDVKCGLKRGSQVIFTSRAMECSWCARKLVQQGAGLTFE